MSDASSIESRKCSESRFKRPELERSEPRRSFSGAFGPSPPAAEGVARGVDLGYRVIDDYLRQGQNFARTLFDRGTPDASASDPQRLAERMLHYASDLAAAWFEYVRVVGSGAATCPPETGFGCVVPGAVSAAATGRADPFDIEPPPAGSPIDATAVSPAPTAPEPASGTRIALTLASKQPAEVVIDLKPGSAGSQLSAHDLRARDPALPRISGVLVASDAQSDLVTIEIQVPDDQPAAAYHGIILDEATNLPRGTLSLRVGVRGDEAG